MAHIHGKNADVDDGSSVTGAKNWTVSYDGDVVETTDYADAGVKAYIAGGTGWTATYEVNKDGAPPHAMHSSNSYTFKESATANQTWVGTGIVTNIGSSAPIDGLVVYTYSVQGSGALTIPTA